MLAIGFCSLLTFGITGSSAETGSIAAGSEHRTAISIETETPESQKEGRRAVSAWRLRWPVFPDQLHHGNGPCQLPGRHDFKLGAEQAGIQLNYHNVLDAAVWNGSAKISNLTWPVAPATIIAGKMTNVNYVKVCGHTMKMSLSALILPYLFVFLPALLINGSPLENLNVVGTTIAGLILPSFFA